MKKYELKWEILSAAELVDSLPENMPVPQIILNKIYKGTAMRLFVGTPVPRKWEITIVTKAQADNGELHTHTMSFKPDQKVGLHALMEHIKNVWIAECDKDLAGMTALSAHATARCFV